MYYVERVLDDSHIYIRDTKDLVLECYTLSDLKEFFIEYDVKIEGFKGTYVVENTCFQLKNKNKLVGEFCISNDLEYSSFYRLSKLVPLDFTSIKDWIKSRKVFTCAKDIKEFFASIGVESDIDFIEIFNCISLHDTFWISNYLSTKTWLDVSPYHNDYSKFVSDYSLDGIIGNKDFNYLSPDVATSGSFPSTWRFKGVDNIEYIKASSKYTLGGRNSGNEPHSEYFAGKVASYLGFDSVDYRIRNYTRGDGRKDVVTVCKSFTSSNVGSITAYNLGLNSYKDVIEYCRLNLDYNSFNTILNMLFLDCVLLNTDRHFSNIEFLFDNDTLEILRIAPIFDNNWALLPRFIEGYDEFIREDYFARDGETFEEVFNLISCYKNFTKLLIKLKSFKFINNSQCPISDTRLKFLNDFLQMQVKYYLSRC